MGDLESITVKVMITHLSGRQQQICNSNRNQQTINPEFLRGIDRQSIPKNVSKVVSCQGRENDELLNIFGWRKTLLQMDEVIR